ncbi:hypothetical protein AAIR98_001060 [Elusimicrobium simillimum]|uniref:CpXC domain-containing protein n=1 Tax=Elusimicrobium simillimum TaxID=3143438 RepID=UPI003C7024A8
MKSIKGSANIKCPHGCEEFESEFWSLIDAASAPELKDAALGGELNLMSCPTCKHYFYHENNLIYFDAPTGLLVFVFDEKEKKNEKEIKEKMHHDFELIKHSIAKEMKIGSEPLYVFGLEALKNLIAEENDFVEESEVVAAASASLGYKLATLKPEYARNSGYPLYVPVKAGNTQEDLLKSAHGVLASGVNSARLKKFEADLKGGKTTALFL